uniref:Uncharacterized protein n=1 Tax=Candidatus Kentrum sp. TC TaxID=2126339 RepID=A0A451A022_9GAMM|nr:MAG: hypothetical protein BECKTC1821F_GA0114240_10331 [Candidatus Kentron sp. TC]
MSTENNHINPMQKVWNVARNLLTKWFIPVTVATWILVAGILEITGNTLVAWPYFSALFTERISVLTADELEVANEWVIRVDSGATFSQVNAHKDRLFRVALLEGKQRWWHFTRNLRIVRDPKTKGGSSSNRVGNLP